MKANLSQRDIRQLDGLMRDYGLFARDGFTTSGCFTVSHWSSGKPPAGRRTATARRKVKPLLPPYQPKETPPTASSRVLTGKIEYRLEKVHKKICRMPSEYRIIINCLYIRGMCFADVSVYLGITSREVGDYRHRILQAIDSVV